MKSYCILFLLVLFEFNSFAQSKTIDLNYKVQYEFTNKNKLDTLEIRFNKEGTYLYTDNDYLAKDLARSIYSASRNSQYETQIDIILDVKDDFVFINFEGGKNRIYFQMDINDFLPKSNSPVSSIDSIINTKEISIICEKTAETTIFNGKEYPFYRIYPDAEADKPILVAFDTSKEFTINTLFNSLVSKVIASSNERIKPAKIQEGIIIEVKDHNNKTLIRALEIKDELKSISINYSFKAE